jgi:phospholipase D3/4
MVCKCGDFESGTSNWSGDYFTTTAGVGLIINQTDALQNSGNSVKWRSPGVTSTVQQQLVDVFERDWNSVYAHPISDFPI